MGEQAPALGQARLPHQADAERVVRELLEAATLSGAERDAAVVEDRHPRAMASTTSSSSAPRVNV